MRRLIGLALLAALSFVAYRWFTGWRAYRAYEGFAEAWVRGDKAEAGKYGEAAAVRHALEERSLRGTPGGSIIEAFRGTRYSVDSRSRTADGDVELEVKQTIHFDPPGTTTAIGGAMYIHFHHAATVRRTPDGWRVVSFEPTYLDMGEIRRRP